LDRNTLKAMPFFRMAEQHLPRAGGLLDQTQTFVNLLDWYVAEENDWRTMNGLNK
jgi:hypothetical protein